MVEEPRELVGQRSQYGEKDLKLSVKTLASQSYHVGQRRWPVGLWTWGWVSIFDRFSQSARDSHTRHSLRNVRVFPFLWFYCFKFVVMSFLFFLRLLSFIVFVRLVSAPPTDWECPQLVPMLQHRSSLDDRLLRAFGCGAWEYHHRQIICTQLYGFKYSYLLLIII